MSKKYEEMTRKELEAKADEILNKFKEDIYGNASTSTFLNNVDNLQEIINIMKSFKIDVVKEKIESIPLVDV